ncbi:MAG: hypothetical protein ACKVQA_25990 [Burkholderiales bacterium]
MRKPAVMGRFSVLASLKLAFAAMLLLAAVVLASHFEESVSRAWMAVPLAVLAVNLLAALLCNPRLRGQPGLALFHIALLLLCVLAGVETMTRLHGRIELAEGQTFSVQDIHVEEKGPWHPGGLHHLAFTQGPIDVEFAPGLVRQRARSQVRIGIEEPANGDEELTDDKALELGGYRFSVTPNKGFAAVLEWRGEDGGEFAGAVHLPSFPAREWKQEQRWTTPGGEHVVIALVLAKRPPRERAWMLRSQLGGASIEIRTANISVKLQPGEAVKLRRGTLRLREIALWMGYRVDYQSLLPWMLWIALLGLCGLAWYVMGRFWRTNDAKSEGMMAGAVRSRA